MFFYYKIIIAIKSKLNICPRYWKAVKSISDLTKHINACKIWVPLPSCPFQKLELVLKYSNILSLLDVLLDNNKKTFRLANIDK